MRTIAPDAGSLLPCPLTNLPRYDAAFRAWLGLSGRRLVKEGTQNDGTNHGDRSVLNAGQRCLMPCSCDQR